MGVQGSRGKGEQEVSTFHHFKKKRKTNGHVSAEPNQAVLGGRGGGGEEEDCCIPRGQRKFGSGGEEKKKKGEKMNKQFHRGEKVNTGGVPQRGPVSLYGGKEEGNLSSY